MCGRFLLESDIEELLRFYKISNEPSFNIEHKMVYPSQETPIVIRSSNENRIGLMKWGFSISGINRLVINSRVEGIFHKNSFQQSISQRRCIVPATAFLEWKDKVPYTIQQADQSIMSLAGIYKKALDEKGVLNWQFSILTRPANSHMTHIHHRMPLILDEGKVIQWMDPKSTHDQIVHLLQEDIGTLEIHC